MMDAPGAPAGCPICGQTASVQKVSAVYIDGIGSGAQAHGRPAPSAQRRLAQRLAPPSRGQRPLTHLLHPDWLAGAAAGIAPVFLYGIYTSQRPLFWPVVLSLALVYGLYFWQRPTLAQRYHDSRRRQQAETEQTQQALERWMRLYYCATDDIVFDPQELEPIPADHMLAYLQRS